VKHLPKDSLLSMVQGDQLHVGEEAVFDAVLCWCDANKGEGKSAQDEFAAFLPAIRFAAMSHVFLHKRVTPSGMVPNDVVMAAFVAQLDNPALQHTGKRALEGGKECERSTKRRSRDGVHGKELVWKGRRYAVLPEGDGPSAAKAAQDKDAHDIPVGARVVDVGDKDWAGILENVVKPYRWNTDIIVVRDKAKDTSPGYWTAGQYNLTGEKFESDCTSWITWSNYNRHGMGEHGTFKFKNTSLRVLIAYK
jgi:hypothetical protein